MGGTMSDVPVRRRHGQRETRRAKRQTTASCPYIPSLVVRMPYFGQTPLCPHGQIPVPASSIPRLHLYAPNPPPFSLPPHTPPEPPFNDSPGPTPYSTCSGTPVLW